MVEEVRRLALHHPGIGARREKSLSVPAQDDAVGAVVEAGPHDRLVELPHHLE